MFGNPCFLPQNPQKQEIISELFLQNFCEFEKIRYFQKKILNFRILNYSETGENEKFGNFCITQGLTLDETVKKNFRHFLLTCCNNGVLKKHFKKKVKRLL